MATPTWISVATDSRTLFRADDVLYIAEPLGDRKPPGWLDGMAACIFLRDGVYPQPIWIAKEDWSNVKNQLNILEAVWDDDYRRRTEGVS